MTKKYIYRVFFTENGNEEYIDVWALSYEDVYKMFESIVFSDGTKKSAEEIKWIEFIG